MATARLESRFLALLVAITVVSDIGAVVYICVNPYLSADSSKMVDAPVALLAFAMLLVSHCVAARANFLDENAERTDQVRRCQHQQATQLRPKAQKIFFVVYR